MTQRLSEMSTLSRPWAPRRTNASSRRLGSSSRDAADSARHAPRYRSSSHVALRTEHIRVERVPDGDHRFFNDAIEQERAAGSRSWLAIQSGRIPWKYGGNCDPVPCRGLGARLYPKPRQALPHPSTFVERRSRKPPGFQKLLSLGDRLLNCLHRRPTVRTAGAAAGQKRLWSVYLLHILQERA